MFGARSRTCVGVVFAPASRAIRYPRRAVSGRGEGGGKVGAFDVSWLPVSSPLQPQTCVDCGGVSLRGFIFCGWCGAKLRDETQVHAEEPALRRPSAAPYTGYKVEPVELEVSERITLVHWPVEAASVREQTQKAHSDRLDATYGGSTLALETDPGGAPTGFASGGLCIVVLGMGPNGVYDSPSDVQVLALGDELDVVVNEAGVATAFRVERGGLRIVDNTLPRAISRKVDGAARLRDGSAFRIGSTWLLFERVDRLADRGVFGRVCVLAPSGHVITAYHVGESGFVVGRDLSDPTLSIDPHIVGRHCRIVAGPNGATIEDLPDSGGTYLACDEGDFLGLGCIAVFGDTAVRLDPLAPGG